jgi:hypothetical protein
MLHRWGQKSCNPNKHLDEARQKLYAIAGGRIDSSDVRKAELTVWDRIAFFHSREFRDWVAYELDHGRPVFWLKDVDKTQAAGDIFTFFYKWRTDNNAFSPRQLQTVQDELFEVLHALELDDSHLPLKPENVLNLWLSRDSGGPGITLLDLWLKFYWPSQIGFTKEEKMSQAQQFAPDYKARIYPGAKEDNEALTEAGVFVVANSNGDEELLIAAAPNLGIDPKNVVGSPLKYGPDGRSTGENHTYESFAEEWADRPQPGKVTNFHYWLHKNRHRFGLAEDLSPEKFVIAGRDGDSASADGGMMIYLPPAAIGNFMINTPGEPDRIAKFYALASKYGWGKGQYFTLHQSPSQLGRIP